MKAAAKATAKAVPKTKMFTPQEIEVWYVMPSVRRALAKEMGRQKIKQKDIAAYLGLTEAAISQYLSSKRGAEMTFPKEIQAEIQSSVKEITEKKSHLIALREVQRLTKIIFDTQVICKMHHSQDKSLPRKCDICFTTG